MPDETTSRKSDWAQRMEQLLSGAPSEQVRAAMQDVRSGVDASLGALAEKLDAQAERLLGAFAQRVGALQTAIVREAETSAARAHEADAELARVTATVAEALETLRNELAESRAAFERRLTEHRAALDRDLSEVAQQHGVQLPSTAELVSELHERLREDVDAVLGASSARLDQKLEAFGAAVESTAGKLRNEIEVFGRSAEAHDARIAAAGDEQQAKLDQAIGRLDSVAAEMRSIADVRVELSALSGELSRAVKSLDTARAGFGAAVEGLRAHLETATTQISARMDTVEAAVDKSVAEGQKALSTVRADAGSLLDEVRSAIASVAERVEAIEPLREQVGVIAESINAQLVQRTAGVKSTITERTGRIEELLRGIPGAEQIAASVEPLITGIREAGDERAQALARDVDGRVRAVTKALEEVRRSMADIASATEARIAEVQENLVASLQTLETERDRVFIDTMNELLARLPKPDRATFGQRLRLLTRRKRSEASMKGDQELEEVERGEAATDVPPIVPPAPAQPPAPAEPLPAEPLAPAEPLPVEPPPSKPAAPARPRAKKPPAKRTPKRAGAKTDAAKQPPRAKRRRTPIPDESNASISSPKPPRGARRSPPQGPETPPNTDQG